MRAEKDVFDDAHIRHATPRHELPRFLSAAKHPARSVYEQGAQLNTGRATVDELRRPAE
jgi:hypothetical protein